MRTLITMCVVAALALPIPLASAAPASGSGSDRVRVDTSALGSGFEAVQRGLDEKARAVVEASSIDPSRVELVLEWLDDGAFSYVIEVKVAPKHQGARAVAQTETCRNCVTDEIVDKSLQHLAAVLELAEAADAEAPAPVEAREDAGAGEQTIDPPPQVKVDDRSSRSMGPLAWAGVGLLATGTVTLITGATFLGVGEREASNFPTKLRDYRPAGIGLTVAGGVALVTGAVLLAVGVRRKPNTRASVGFGPGTASLVLTGRF